ncbi:MAG: endonuclease MutS2, partial [Chloroflexi bacterium]|nr:endonuclease MutS2 [Chloroflexota bacterium]
MIEKTLHTLEFDKIRERLAQYTSFAASRELALNLSPSSNYEEVLTRQRATREAGHLIEARPNLSASGAHDVREAAHRASLGGVLDAETLLGIKSTLATTRFLRSAIRSLRRRLPTLWSMAEGIEDCSFLEKAIGDAINPRGEVMDGASPLLEPLRQEIKRAHDRLLAKLDDILASEWGRQVIQEPLITQREGRYVIPIKADYRHQVKGIVHDVSASGATVFVEPLETVELSNLWHQMQWDERREVERILRSLSQGVGEKAEVIETIVASLAELDLAMAKAKYGSALEATEPRLGKQFNLKLIDAWHPLLPGDVVPISVTVGGDFSVLLITGPNTGGKTVALKTIGLLSLMAQAGIPIPAAKGSQIPVFDAVYADIGDEQSIEQSLSTFSSHMGSIIQILNEATPQSLVLLDELGAGTDPDEGSALARAVLSHLMERGITTVATTHHGELKAFVQATPGARNAAVEFDAETLAPTYKITMGLPGPSNAMAIAARLGLPQEIIAKAQALIAPEEREAESLLADIQRERDEAESQRHAVTEKLAQLQTLEQSLAEEWRHLTQDRDEILESARQEVAEEIARLRRRLRQAAATLEGQAPEVAAARSDLTAVSRELRQFQPWPAGPTPSLTPGSLVWIPSLQQWGQILSRIDAAGEVEVQLGTLRTKIRASQIDKVLPPSSPPPS